MVAPEIETQFPEHPAKILVAVIDDCNDSEAAVLELLRGGSHPRDVQLFHGHPRPEHTGVELGQLNRTLEYLQDLLALDGSIFSEYVAYGKTGHHIVLTIVRQDDQVNNLAQAFASKQAHNVRLLSSSHMAQLRPTSVRR